MSDLLFFTPAVKGIKSVLSVWVDGWILTVSAEISLHMKLGLSPGCNSAQTQLKLSLN